MPGAIQGNVRKLYFGADRLHDKAQDQGIGSVDADATTGQRCLDKTRHGPKRYMWLRRAVSVLSGNMSEWAETDAELVWHS